MARLEVPKRFLISEVWAADARDEQHLWVANLLSYQLHGECGWPTPFFRVAEDSCNDLQGSKSSEAICVHETLAFACFSHREIVLDFAHLSNT